MPMFADSMPEGFVYIFQIFAHAHTSDYSMLDAFDEQWFG